MTKPFRNNNNQGTGHKTEYGPEEWELFPAGMSMGFIY
jgi:hypothetical protein